MDVYGALLGSLSLPVPVSGRRNGCWHQLEFQNGERRLFLEINIGEVVDAELRFTSRLEGGDLSHDRVDGSVMVDADMELLGSQFRKLCENA